MSQDLQDLTELVKNYKPNQNVVEAAKKIRILAFVGPSAVGKTTLMEAAVEIIPDLTMVGGVTSRPQRPGESTKEFEFVSREEVVSGINKGAYVQVAITPAGDLYATRLEDYDINKVGAMAVLSSVINQFRALFGEVTVAAVTPPSFAIWMERFNERNKAKADNQKRLAEAKTSLEFVLNDSDIHFILNDDLNEAIEQTKQLLGGHSDKAKEIAAKEIAHQIYDQLLSL